MQGTNFLTANQVATGILAGVLGFELCSSEILGAFRTFIYTNSWYNAKYSIISNCFIHANILKGNLKGENKSKFLLGTCFLQNDVYTNN